MVYLLKMVIFHRYVSLPEGMSTEFGASFSTVKVKVSHAGHLDHLSCTVSQMSFQAHLVLWQGFEDGETAQMVEIDHMKKYININTPLYNNLIYLHIMYILYVYIYICVHAYNIHVVDVPFPPTAHLNAYIFLLQVYQTPRFKVTPLQLVD